MLINDPIDHTQRVRAFLRRHLTQDKVNGIGESESIGPGRRSLSVPIKGVVACLSRRLRSNLRSSTFRGAALWF